MYACSLEIGPNLLRVLLGIGAAVSPLIGAATLILAKRVRTETAAIHNEVLTNHGGSLADAVNRTEATVAVIADAQGIPHPTPPAGIPATPPPVEPGP